MVDETSHETQQAIDGERTAALALWSRVACGEFTADVRMWLTTVAAGVLDAAGETDAKRRPDRLMQALGLGGREDPHRELCELVAALDGLADLDGPSRRGSGTAAVLKMARARGLIGPAVDDHDARKKIARLRRTIVMRKEKSIRAAP